MQIASHKAECTSTLRVVWDDEKPNVKNKTEIPETVRIVLSDRKLFAQIQQFPYKSTQVCEAHQHQEMS